MISASKAKKLAISKQPKLFHAGVMKLLESAEQLIHSRASDGLFDVEMEIARFYGNKTVYDFTSILEDRGYVVARMRGTGKACTTLMIRWE